MIVIILILLPIGTVHQQGLVAHAAPAIAHAAPIVAHAAPIVHHAPAYAHAPVLAHAAPLAHAHAAPAVRFFYLILSDSMENRQT